MRKSILSKQIHFLSLLSDDEYELLSLTPTAVTLRYLKSEPTIEVAMAKQEAILECTRKADLYLTINTKWN